MTVMSAIEKVLSAVSAISSKESELRARAIFAAIAGAQLLARSRSDIALFDELIESYRVAGLLGLAPALPEGLPDRLSVAAQTDVG